MFEDNVFAAERVLNSETVVLSVVMPNLQPIRDDDDDDDDDDHHIRCLIVASKEEPVCQSDATILATLDIDKKTTHFSPMREKLPSDPQLHEGMGASIIRGYATMLTALGIKVLVPVEMTDREAETKREQRKKSSKGGWLVVEKPGIGGEAPIYKSSEDAPPVIGYELEEFDPTSLDCFDMRIAVLPEIELHRILDSEETVVSFSETTNDKHKDFPFWNALLGDPLKKPEPKKRPEEPSPLSSPNKATLDSVGRVSNHYKNRAKENLSQYITRDDVWGY